jgi:glycerophosphoryl diester phosphodiesterase
MRVSSAALGSVSPSEAESRNGTGIVAHAAGNDRSDIARAAGWGASFVEADVHLSADGRLVLYRELLDGVDMAATGMHSLTICELTDLRRAAGLPPPLELHEAIATCHDQSVGLVIDLKTGPPYHANAPKRVAERLAEADESLIVTSYDHISIGQLAATEPRYRLGLTLTARPNDPARLLAEVGATVLWIQNRFATPDVIAATQSAGAQVCVATEYHPRAFEEYLAAPPAADLVSCDLSCVATLAQQ